MVELLWDLLQASGVLVSVPAICRALHAIAVFNEDLLRVDARTCPGEGRVFCHVRGDFVKGGYRKDDVREVVDQVRLCL